MIQLCAPSLIYIIFSLTHIIIDTLKGLYNTAFFKFIVSILVTFLLQILCNSGMGIISWFIVFIPFIFMTFIVTILLYVFGLDIATGTINLQCNNSNNTNTSSSTSLGGNLIFSTTESNVPTTSTYTITPINTTTISTNSNTNSSSLPPPNYSSDPAYESFISK